MRRAFALLLLCALASQATTTTAAAHALDEYVQAARIALAQDEVRVELKLTPGAKIAALVFASIDEDRDGQLSRAEEQSYARRVMQDVALEVDGRRAPFRLEGVEFPSRQEMDEGVGVIRLDLAADVELNDAGEHRLTLRNEHEPAVSVYFVNALAPTTNEIIITGQERDPLQRELRLGFSVAPAVARGPRPWTVVLILSLSLLILFPQFRHLGRYARRFRR